MIIAQTPFFNSIRNNKDIKEYNNISLECYDIGNSYFVAENYIYAEEYYTKALTTVDKNDSFFVSELYFRLAVTNSKRNLHNKAYIQYQHAIESIFIKFSC